MKTIIQIFSFIIILLMISPSCKKDQLQPTWLWLKNEMLILEHMATVHENNKDRIETGRTTVGEYNWNGEIITLNGPASYHILASYATNDLKYAYQQLILPDTTKLENDTEVAHIIDSYLDERRKHPASDAFYKLKLTIPSDLYEPNTRFGEMVLGFFKWYLVDIIGGPHEDTNGTRQLWVEREIRRLFTDDDENFQDPWQCNCSPAIYFNDWYLNFAEGPDKSAKTEEKIKIEREIIQEEFAQKRYQFFSEKYGGTIDDYRTQYDAESDCYYIGVPLN